MRLFNFIRNIWVFRKFLWKYANWDYAGLFIILALVFEDMERAHFEDNNHQNHKIISRQLKYAKTLADLVYTEHYKDLYLNKLEAEIGRPFKYELKPTKRSNSLRIERIYVPNDKCQNLTEAEYLALYNEALKKGARKHQKASKRLFLHINKYYHRWWI